MSKITRLVVAASAAAGLGVAEVHRRDDVHPAPPTFADGREAFITGVEGPLAQRPNLERPLTRTIAQGDLVVVEGSMKTGPEDRGTAIDHTFRFDAAGKIVEHWDAIQPVAPSSLNGHPQV